MDFALNAKNIGLSTAEFAQTVFCHQKNVNIITKSPLNLLRSVSAAIHFFETFALLAILLLKIAAKTVVFAKNAKKT